jgi:hypothetical protein
MEHVTLAEFRRRAAHADTIAELRAIAAEVVRDHPQDVDAERLADDCQAFAVTLLAALAHPDRRAVVGRRLAEREVTRAVQGRTPAVTRRPGAASERRNAPPGRWRPRTWSIEAPAA